MNRMIASALALVVLIALAAGCGGGSDDKKKAAAGPAPQEQARQDADAKSNARNLASQMEACYVDQASYEPCALQSDGTVAGTDTGLEQGSGAGQVTATGSADGYEITATSESGNSFAIAKAGGGQIERTCTEKGEGGCPAAGTW